MTKLLIFIWFIATYVSGGHQSKIEYMNASQPYEIDEDSPYKIDNLRSQSKLKLKECNLSICYRAER